MNSTLPARPTSFAADDSAASHHHPSEVREIFRKFAATIAMAVGTAWVFLLALIIVLVWALTGPIFHFSDTWQLVINTGTTIITFLMVFLIQNTQNREARAIHLKLDELIKGSKSARNLMVDLENCSEEELDQLEQEFHRVRSKAGQKRAPKRD